MRLCGCEFASAVTQSMQRSRVSGFSGTVLAPATQHTLLTPYTCGEQPKYLNTCGEQKT